MISQIIELSRDLLEINALLVKAGIQVNKYRTTALAVEELIRRYEEAKKEKGLK